MPNLSEINTANLYGSAAIEKMAEGLEFPVSREKLLQSIGDRFVDWTKGHSVKIRGILEECTEDEFSDVAMLVSAIREVMRRREMSSEVP